MCVPKTSSCDDSQNDKVTRDYGRRIAATSVAICFARGRGHHLNSDDLSNYHATVWPMSAMRPKADIVRSGYHACYVPLAEIARLARNERGHQLRRPFRAGLFI